MVFPLSASCASLSDLCFAVRAGFDTCRPVIVTEPLRGFGKQRRRTAACQGGGGGGGGGEAGRGLLSLLSASFLMMSRGF